MKLIVMKLVGCIELVNFITVKRIVDTVESISMTFISPRLKAVRLLHMFQVISLKDLILLASGFRLLHCLKRKGNFPRI
jgi:hypothetical protein